MEDFIINLKSLMTNAVEKNKEKFASNYGKHNLWGNPFSGYENALTGNFHLFTSREKIIENIMNQIVDSLTGNGKDIAIIGPIGCGCRSLVNLINNPLSKLLYSLEPFDEISPQLMEIKNKINRIVTTQSCEFSDPIWNEVRENINEGLKISKSTIITTFFCDEHNVPLDKKTISRVRKILELDTMSKDRVLFLSPWRASMWFCMSNETALDAVYEEVHVLEPLSTEETIRMLNIAIDFFKHDKNKDVNVFTQDALKTIAEYSNGLPRFALNFAHDVLEKCIDEKKSEINRKFVKDKLVLDKKPRSYDEIKNRLKKIAGDPDLNSKPLTGQKTLRELMRLLIALGGNNVTATKISERIERKGITRGLNKIYDKGLIRKLESGDKDARTKPYSVDPFVRAVFENEYLIPLIKKRIENNK